MWCSAYPHGNPIEDVELPPDAWAFRITPYGTRHCTTWAGIVRKLNTEDPDAARELLGSIAGLPGYPKLGGGKAHRYFHPSEPRDGLVAPPELNLQHTPLGSLVIMSELRRNGKVVAEGMLLAHGQGQGRTLWVANKQYLPGVHKVEPNSQSRRK